MGMVSQEVVQLQRRLADLERLVNSLLTPKSKPRVIVGQSNLVAKSPSGGIAARSGTTISSAVCTIWTRSGSTLSATSQTATVYNLSSSAVAGSVYVGIVETNIGYVAVWEDC